MADWPSPFAPEFALCDADLRACCFFCRNGSPCFMHAPPDRPMRVDIIYGVVDPATGRTSYPGPVTEADVRAMRERSHPLERMPADFGRTTAKWKSIRCDPRDARTSGLLEQRHRARQERHPSTCALLRGGAWWSSPCDCGRDEPSPIRFTTTYELPTDDRVVDGRDLMPNDEWPAGQVPTLERQKREAALRRKVAKALSQQIEARLYAGLVGWADPVEHASAPSRVASSYLSTEARS